MHPSISPRKFFPALGLALMALCGAADAATPAWKTQLPAPAQWHRLTGIGTLIVGTGQGLLSLDPDNGKLLWQRKDLANRSQFDVREIDGMPVIVVTAEGKAKAGLTAVNFVTGETAWQSPAGTGSSLGLFPVADMNLVVQFMLAGKDSPDGAGVYVRGLQASDGKELWRTRFRDARQPLQLHAAEAGAKSGSRQDLSGHQEPLVAEGVMYVPFDGIAALDLGSGRVLWDRRFQTADKDYKRAYPAPLLDGSLVLAGGRDGVLYALETSSGAVRWQSPRVKSGLVSELVATGDTVYARLGGNFYSQKAGRFTLDAPVGVVAINKADGAQRWAYLGAKDGITNLVYDPARKVLAFADAYSLIGLQSGPGAKPIEAFKVPIEFKRKISGSEMTATGIKLASGFLGGGLAGALQGGLSGSGDKDRLDVPVAMQPWQGGQLLVRGQQHLLMFDTAARRIAWSTYYPAPGSSGFALAAMAALTMVATAADTSAQVQNYAAGLGQGVVGAWGGLDDLASRRYSASKDAGRYTYVLTEVDEGGSKGVGIMAVDMATGAPATQILLGDKEPDYRVDDVVGRLYYFKGHRDVSAFALR
ncbi:MAG: PQQ-binding-like beta-propeller repeat protein [Gammaproteobacteria bacterium]|nr:PQQ-binding-like beta-propeller repeat protein [Gammaproteobacteria bacterium]